MERDMSGSAKEGFIIESIYSTTLVHLNVNSLTE